MKITLPQKCCIPGGKLIVCEENGKKLTFCNPGNLPVTKHVVDQCKDLRRLLKNKSCKLCDYIVVDWRNEEHYVELKGRNVEHALKQLESTLEELRSTDSKEDFYCWVIGRGIPSNASKFGPLKEKFRSRFSARLFIRTSDYRHNL